MERQLRKRWHAIVDWTKTSTRQSVNKRTYSGKEKEKKKNVLTASERAYPMGQHVLAIYQYGNFASRVLIMALVHSTKSED